MLKVEVDEVNGIVVLEPQGPLTKDDFVSAANVIDPYIEDAGRLSGLAIHTRAFPGWESFAALCSHLVFVKAHHRKISRIALCTNSLAADFAQAIAGHFVNAEIKVFPYQDLEQGKQWLIDAPNEK